MAPDPATAPALAAPVYDGGGALVVAGLLPVVLVAGGVP
jgi:hypothetical protein